MFMGATTSPTPASRPSLVRESRAGRRLGASVRTTAISSRTLRCHSVWTSVSTATTTTASRWSLLQLVVGWRRLLRCPICVVVPRRSRSRLATLPKRTSPKTGCMTSLLASTTRQLMSLRKLQAWYSISSRSSSPSFVRTFPTASAAWRASVRWDRGRWVV